MFNIYLKGIFENNKSPTPAFLNQLEATKERSSKLDCQFTYYFFKKIFSASK